MTQIFNVLIIVFMFFIFAISHSLLASTSVKKRIQAIHQSKILLYRSFYNIISILSLLLIFILTPSDDTIIYELQYPFDIIIFVIRIIFLISLFVVMFYFDGLEFLGIKQIGRYIKGSYAEEELDEKSSFIIHGPFKYSRHPLYLFSILFLAASPEMDLNYLTYLICIIAYFWVGSFFEEKKLEEKFGQNYLDYKEITSRIFPAKWFLKKLKVQN